VDLNRPADQLLMRLLDAASLRHKVIANNVANANTPGFVRDSVKFEHELADAMRRGKSIFELEPVVTKDETTPVGFDGNNVTPEVEMNSLNENRILFEMYSSILASKTEMLRASIEER